MRFTIAFYYFRKRVERNRAMISVQSIPKRKIIIWMITIAEILTISIAAYWHNAEWINSDFSSELVLAEKLNEESALLSQGWYYSTELRVLNTQLITMPLFSIFDDWAMIRAVSIFICLLILALSYAFFCKNTFGESGLIALPLLICPFSYDYFDIVLVGSFYVPHITISFVSMGLYYKLLRHNKNKMFYILAGIYLLLAFLAGAGGFRQLLELYIPVVLAVFYLGVKKASHIREFFSRNVILAGAGLCAGGVGLLFNQVLHQVYRFANMSAMTTVSLNGEKLFLILNGILNSFGYRPGNSVFSLQGILSMGVVVIIFVIGHLIAVVIKDKDKEEYGHFLLFSILCHFTLFLFTDTAYTDRYWLPLLAMTLPLLGWAGMEQKIAFKYKFMRMGAIAAGVLLLANGGLVLKEKITMPENQARNEVVEFLVDNDYFYGYAKFWSANVLTELTDGSIRVNTMLDWNGFQTNCWLIHEEDIGRVLDEKIFVLVDKSDGTDHSSCTYMDAKRIVFENAEYRVYSYENTQDLLQYLN